MQRRIRRGDVAEAFKKVDLAVRAVAIADRPASSKLNLNGAQSSWVEAYNAGQRPQSLPGIWAKSPINTP